MTLTIDFKQYVALNAAVRARFDEWLRVEGLDDKWLMEMTVGEGFVDVIRLASEGTQPVLNLEGEPVKIEMRYLVKTPPSLDVFESQNGSDANG